MPELRRSSLRVPPIGFAHPGASARARENELARSGIDAINLQLGLIGRALRRLPRRGALRLPWGPQRPEVLSSVLLLGVDAVYSELSSA